RVVRAAVGESGIDDALTSSSRLAVPGVPLAEIKVAASTKDRALQLLELGGGREPAAPGSATALRPVIALKGPRRSGRKHLARALCRELGRPLLVLTLAGLPREPSELGRLARSACRDALLAGAALYVDDADEHTDAEGPVVLPRPLGLALARFP